MADCEVCGDTDIWEHACNAGGCTLCEPCSDYGTACENCRKESTDAEVRYVLERLKGKMGTMYAIGSSLEWMCDHFGSCDESNCDIDDEDTPPFYVISKEEFDKFVGSQ